MKKALITGGGGFVGQAIVRQLRARDVECLVVGRHVYPQVEALDAKCLQGDIGDRDFMRACCRGWTPFSMWRPWPGSGEGGGIIMPPTSWVRPMSWPGAGRQG